MQGSTYASNLLYPGDTPTLLRVFSSALWGGKSPPPPNTPGSLRSGSKSVREITDTFRAQREPGGLGGLPPIEWHVSPTWFPCRAVGLSGYRALVYPNQSWVFVGSGSSGCSRCGRCSRCSSTVLGRSGRSMQASRGSARSAVVLPGDHSGGQQRGRVCSSGLAGPPRGHTRSIHRRRLGGSPRAASSGCQRVSASCKG